MSDSDGSDSFLSADEGDANNANDSSDITLSSDSEDENAEKRPAVELGSSDITLSSDDDAEDQKPVSSGTAKAEAVASKPATEPSVLHSINKMEKQTDGKSDISNIPPFDKTISKSQDIDKQNASKDSQAPVSDSNKPNVSSVAKKDPESASSAGSLPKEEAMHEKRDTTLSDTSCKDQPISDPDRSEVGGTNIISPVLNEPLESGWSDLEDILESSASTVNPELPVGGVAMVEHVKLPYTSPTSEEVPERVGAPDHPRSASPGADGVSMGPEECTTEKDASSSQPPPPAAAERAVKQRPERRERRGPMKLGAKKLGVKVASAVTEPAVSEAAPTTTFGSVTKPDSQLQQGSKPSHQTEQDGWGGWESWGTSLLSSARDVTKTLVETVETGFGAPDPEELARITHQQQQEQEVIAPHPAASVDADGGGLGGWFGGVSRVLGQTSSLVVNTGLDTLEAIGKKTMDVLQDDQLGIHDTIKGLGGSKPCLSQALREARQKRGDTVPGASPAQVDTSPATFSRLFDQCQGTVHLEALEMLSDRTQTRVTSARSRCDEAGALLLDLIQDACSDDVLEGGVGADDFESEVNALVSRLHVPIKPSRLLIAHSSAASWLGQQGDRAATATPAEALARSVHCSGDLAAGLAAFCHKLAELLLLPGGERRPDGGGTARALAQLVVLVAGEAGALAARHAELLSAQRDERAAAATTDIYLEASYMQQFCTDVLRLMTPVLQMKALEDK